MSESMNVTGIDHEGGDVNNSHRSQRPVNTKRRKEEERNKEPKKQLRTPKKMEVGYKVVG
jgi:hypothetical protein